MLCVDIQNGYKTWALNKRDGEFVMRIYEIVDYYSKKNLYVGTKCKFAIKYLDEMYFYKSKCKISKELAEVFEKI